MLGHGPKITSISDSSELRRLTGTNAVRSLIAGSERAEHAWDACCV